MPIFFIAALLALLADQFSKIWIRGQLLEGESRDFLPGVMHLEHVQNHGAAWSVLSGQKWLLIVFTVVVVGGIAVSAREVTSRNRLAALGFGLILGGALGNLLDRIWFSSVTDFFDLDTPWQVLQTFPVFNVADSALTVGVVLMLLSFLFSREKAPIRASQLDSSS